MVEGFLGHATQHAECGIFVPRLRIRPMPPDAPGWLQFYQRLPLSLSRFQVFAVVVCLFCFVSAKLDATLIANLNFRRF